MYRNTPLFISQYLDQKYPIDNLISLVYHNTEFHHTKERKYELQDFYVRSDK